MAIKQKIMEDVIHQRLILETNISRSDLVDCFNETDFYSEIYKRMAIMIADKIFEKIGPAIDKAMKEMSNEL